MKKSIIILSFVFSLMVLITACGPKNPPSKPTNFGEFLSIVSPYISDNYMVGDSVVFVKETGLSEVFVVSISGVSELIVPKDESSEETENSDFEYDTISVSSCVTMSSQNYSIDLAIGSDKANTSAFFQVYLNDYPNEGIGWTNIDISAMSRDYSYTNPIGHTCLLRKGEGIIQFADTLGHTWTKK